MQSRRTAEIGPVGSGRSGLARRCGSRDLAARHGDRARPRVAYGRLGGGFGYLTRQFDWTVDNLLEVEVVTADGIVRTADRAREPACSGRFEAVAANLGVITRFTVALHQVGYTGATAAMSAATSTRLAGWANPSSS
jgi:hypothetical protein